MTSDANFIALFLALLRATCMRLFVCGVCVRTPMTMAEWKSVYTMRRKDFNKSNDAAEKSIFG